MIQCTIDNVYMMLSVMRERARTNSLTLLPLGFSSYLECFCYRRCHCHCYCCCCYCWFTYYHSLSFRLSNFVGRSVCRSIIVFSHSISRSDGRCYTSLICCCGFFFPHWKHIICFILYKFWINTKIYVSNKRQAMARTRARNEKYTQYTHTYTQQ